MASTSAADGNSKKAKEPLTLLWGTWELWCDISQSSSPHHSNKSNWLDHVKSIGLFDSAEGFWGLHDCAILPSQLPANGSYYMFRKHIAPMWEHEANRRGGKWVIQFSGRAQSAGSASQPVDTAWQLLCLSAIGELFPGREEEICGVTVSRGKQRGSSSFSHSALVEWKLCLWTRTAEDETSQKAIAEYIRKLLLMSCKGEGIEAGETHHRSGYKCDDRPTPSPVAISDIGCASTISYMAHRELMAAKQKFSKGGSGAAQPFKPKYTLSLA